MSELIYCKRFTHSPRDCSGIAYQVTYDQYGNPDGAYRCNLCYTENSMSEHTVLLATQKYVDQLEKENHELRARNAELELQIVGLQEVNFGLNELLDNARVKLEYWRRLYYGDIHGEF
jgi:hypothetical protein